MIADYEQPQLPFAEGQLLTADVFSGEVWKRERAIDESYRCFIQSALQTENLDNAGLAEHVAEAMSKRLLPRIVRGRDFHEEGHDLALLDGPIDPRALWVDATRDRATSWDARGESRVKDWQPNQSYSALVRLENRARSLADQSNGNFDIRTIRIPGIMQRILFSSTEIGEAVELIERYSQTTQK